MDNGITEGTCKQYAYLGLGNIEQAIAVNDSILAKYDNAGSFYDAACLYSRMGKADEALEYLRKAFEKGFRRIKHMEADNDLDGIRHTPEYKKILLEYNDLLQKDNGSLFPTNESNLEIPIYPKGDGTFAVKCIVNGLPMDFLLDTGSSSVSLSSTESDFMLKNGYLSAGDFKGYLKYRNASGDTRTAREIIIKEIKIGDRAIKNVKAVIIPNQEAPLLLGQNVLNRLGTLEIDHRNNMLKIHSYHK